MTKTNLVGFNEKEFQAEIDLRSTEYDSIIFNIKNRSSTGSENQGNPTTPTRPVQGLVDAESQQYSYFTESWHSD